jgi:hypothetical protein
VNGQHLRAFLWLRWRIRVNQLRRGGIANAVLLAVLASGALGLAVVLFVALFLVGLLALADAPPFVLLVVWDGLVVGLLFCWAIGLLTELQRTEALSLEKFMHLPVSLAGAFLINYLSSLLSLTLLLFVPALVGLSLGLAFGRGPAMLLLLPLLAALLLAVTALTYQFQSWLASLMTNPRRRRTVIVVVTVAFVLLFQLPNLINVIRPWEKPQKQMEEGAARLAQEQADLDRSFREGQITADEHQKRSAALKREQQERDEETKRQALEGAMRTTRLINVALPPGWLPLGAMDLAEGEAWPALLGTLGLTLIGAASLGRAYRTTLRLYTGQVGARKRKAAAAPTPAPAGKPSAGLLAKEIPWASEYAAAIALGGLRSLLRAPEAKMLLLTPVILVVVFGSILLAHAYDMKEPVRPLVACGAMSMVLFSMAQLLGNQFGLDRSGFRVFVLCPAPRREILLGKNLALAPLTLGLGLMVLVLVQVIYPMRVDYFLGLVPQLLSMYLIFCLLGNTLSILAPMRIAAGSLKPSNPKLVPILLHMAFLFLFPVALTPALFPLLLQLLLEELGWTGGVPVGLILSLAVCVGVVYLYRLVLTWQGALLLAREQKILDLVTTRAE